ncbi:MAG: ABC transporter substrate-binding protein [Spirochaetaceae bacterium]|nr:ABC transporter substrate-binding protein [Spirochaetaceae bacterium]
MTVRARTALIAVLAGAALAAGRGSVAGEEGEREPAAVQVMLIDPATGREVPAPRYGGTLTAASAAEMPNTDQAIGGVAAGTANSGVVEKLGIGNWAIDRAVNPLTNPYLDVGHYAGALAQRWEAVDGTTYRFTVRAGVTWHDKEPMNGRPLTAEDVVFNFQRLSGTGLFDEPPPNAGRFRQLAFTTLEARGNEVHIELAKPHPEALPILLDGAHAFILPPEVIAAEGDVADWRNLVGTGPFMLSEWVAGESLSYRRNPAYWGADEKYPDNRLPYVDELRIVIMPEPATWLAALRAGRVDYAGANVATALERFDEAADLLDANPELQAHRYHVRSDQVFAMYVQDEPFDDVRVRRAMQMALDNETIAAIVYQGHALTTPQGVIGRSQPAYVVPYEQWTEELRNGYRYDPEAAESLLDEAGYARGADGVRFTVPLQWPAWDEIGEYQHMALDYWRAVGIQVEVNTIPGRRWVALLDAGRLHGLSPAVLGTSSDPLRALQWQEPAHRWNRGRVDDPVYNEWVAKARAAVTLDERTEAVRQADYRLIEQHWYTWGPSAPSFNIVQPWVHGFNGDTFLGNGQTNAVFARLWIDRG